METMKQNYFLKFQETTSRCRRLEEQLRQRDNELVRERETSRDRLEEQRNIHDKKQIALCKEFELKMKTVSSIPYKGIAYSINRPHHTSVQIGTIDTYLTLYGNTFVVVCL